MAMSAVHKTLATPEILRQILSEHSLLPIVDLTNTQAYGGLLSASHRLRYLDSRRERWNTLLSAALSCRQLCSPALNVLWEVMESIVPLFVLIPGFKKCGGKYTLTQPVDTEKCAIFQSYARRIRHLNIRQRMSDEIDELAFIRIAQLQQGTPLLPLLRSLSQPVEPRVVMLLSPTLCHIRLSSSLKKDSNSDLELATQDIILDLLTSASPLLEWFSFSGELSKTCCTSLQKLQHLRQLSLSPGFAQSRTNYFPLSPLLLFRSLVQLTLKVHTPIEVDEIPAKSLDGLETLTSLSVEANADVVHYFLGFFSQTKAALRSLCITQSPAKNDTIEDQWGATIDHAACWFDTLSRIELYSPNSSSSSSSSAGSNSVVVNACMLEPLLNCEKLETLIFQNTLTLNVSDEEVCAIAVAWPCIRTLRLSGKVGVPAATVVALEMLANTCPDLRTLAMPLDLRRLSESALPALSHGLTRLYTDGMVVDDTCAAAEYLSALFPALDLLSIETHRPEGVDLRRLLKMCHKVRSHWQHTPLRAEGAHDARRGSHTERRSVHGERSSVHDERSNVRDEHRSASDERRAVERGEDDLEDLDLSAISISRSRKLPRYVENDLMNIISTLLKEQVSWLFRDPVDPVKLGIPEYFDIIPRKDARDLKTIKKKLERRNYKMVDKVKADIELMVENAIKYNGADSQAGLDAKAFHARFHELWIEWKVMMAKRLNKQSQNLSPEDAKDVKPQISELTGATV